MESLTIDVSHQGDRALIVLAGELDYGASEQLRTVDVANLAGSGCTDLVVNLSQLTFMDSSGIGSLVNLRNRAASLHMTTVVDSAPLHIQHTITVTGLAGLFGLKR